MSQCQEREPGMERGDTYGGIHIGVPHTQPVCTFIRDLSTSSLSKRYFRKYPSNYTFIGNLALLSLCTLALNSRSQQSKLHDT